MTNSEARSPPSCLFLRFREFSFKDEVFDPEKSAVKYAELFGWALAPEKADAYTVRHVTEWLKWTPGELHGVGETLPPAAVVYRTASVLWDYEDSRFIQVPYNCTTENAYDGSNFRAWRPLTFDAGHSGPHDTDRMTSVWLVGTNFASEALNLPSSDTWQALLDPSCSYMGLRSPSQQPVYGLAGDLALLFGLTAFQVRWKDLVGHVSQSFAPNHSCTSVPPWALNRAINVGLYPYRGLVVELAIDPASTTHEQLEIWESGRFGPILTSSPQYDLHEIVRLHPTPATHDLAKANTDDTVPSVDAWNELAYLDGHFGNRKVIWPNTFKLILKKRFSQMRIVILSKGSNELRTTEPTKILIRRKKTAGEHDKRHTTWSKATAYSGLRTSVATALAKSQRSQDTSVGTLTGVLHEKGDLQSDSETANTPTSQSSPLMVDEMASNDIQSQVASTLSRTGEAQSFELESASSRLLEAEKELARLLMLNKDFRFLCKIATETIGTERLRHQLASLLKYFHSDLDDFVKTNFREPVADRLLRSRWNYKRIAAKCIKCIISDADDRISLNVNLGASYEATTAPQKRLYKPKHNNVSNKVGETNDLGEDEMPNFGDGNKYLGYEPNSFSSHSGFAPDLELEDTDFSDLERLMTCVADGIALSNMLSRLGRFLLPAEVASLVPILRTIPTECIEFKTQEQIGFINRIQCQLERVTGEQWNWWPMRSPKRALKDTESRMYWTCHCKTLRWMEVSQVHIEVLNLMLKNTIGADNYTTRVCHGLAKSKGSDSCGNRTGCERHSDETIRRTRELQRAKRQRQLDRLNESKQERASRVEDSPFHLEEDSDLGQFHHAFGAGSDSGSRVNVSDLTGADSAQQVSHNGPETGQFLKTPQSLIGLPSRGWHDVDAYMSSQIGSGGPSGSCAMYVIFGTSGKRVTLDIENIDYFRHAEDSSFFAEIKKSCRRFRGFWRHYFSVFVLDHCDFSKFEKIRANRVIRRGRGLPDNSEYVYAPRPPDAEMPPVDQHEFQIGFNPCQKFCLLSAFHDCIEEAEGCSAMQRIPKRIKALNPYTEGQEIVWGLEAKFNVSFLKMLFYHILILAGPVGFWLGWQILHAGDYQNASVPVMATASLLSLWWTTLGVWKIQKENR